MLLVANFQTEREIRGLLLLFANPHIFSSIEPQSKKKKKFAGLEIRNPIFRIPSPQHKQTIGMQVIGNRKLNLRRQIGPSSRKEWHSWTIER